MNSQLSISVNWYIFSDSSSHCCFWGNYPIPENGHCAQSTPFFFSKKHNFLCLCVISNTILWLGIIMPESVIIASCHLGHHSDSQVLLSLGNTVQVTLTYLEVKCHNSPDRWVLQLKWAIKSISIVCFISKSSSSETLSSWTCLDQLSIS